MMNRGDESRWGRTQTAGVVTEDKNIPTAVLVIFSTTWPGLNADREAVAMLAMFSRGVRTTGDSGVGATRQGVLCSTEFSSFRHETAGAGLDNVDDATVTLAVQSRGAGVA